MSDFEKIYIDGVSTEKKIEIELRHGLYPPHVADYFIEECKQERKVAEQPDNSRRAIKKGSKRHNKI